MKKISGSKMTFTLHIEEENFKKAQNKVIQNFKKNVSVKGFRKGQAPDDMVIASIGIQRLSDETMNRALTDVYRHFVETEKLAVISAPQIEMPKKGGDKFPLEVSVEVEVFPEVSLGDYKKIKVKQEKVSVSKKEVDDVIESVIAQGENGKEVNRAAKDSDMLEVDFAGKDEKGNVIPKTDGKNSKFRMGFGHFLPDLEKAFAGMKPGESKEAVKVKFPKEYHSADMAGKTIPFDITLHKVFEIAADAITPEIIEKVSGKAQSKEDFRKEVEKTILQNKEKKAQEAVMGEYNEKLAKIVKADLPQSWIEKEIEGRFARLKESPQFKYDPENFWKSLGQTEEQLKKSFATESEKDLKVFLGLSEIIKKEEIELDKDEMEQAHAMAHRELGHDHHHGADHDQAMSRAIQNLKIDKYIKGTILEKA